MCNNTSPGGFISCNIKNSPLVFNAGGEFYQFKLKFAFLSYMLTLIYFLPIFKFENTKTYKQNVADWTLLKSIIQLNCLLIHCFVNIWHKSLEI